MHPEQIATYAIALAAVITAIKVITGWAPIRWLWSKLIVDPVTASMAGVVKREVTPWLEANDRQMLQVLAEIRPNGGGSMKDTVNAIDRRLQRVEAVTITTHDAVTAAD